MRSRKLNFFVFVCLAWIQIHTTNGQRYGLFQHQFLTGNTGSQIQSNFFGTLQTNVQGHRSYLAPRNPSPSIRSISQDVYLPRAYLKVKDVRQTKEALEGKSIPELMKTLKDLIIRKKSETAQDGKIKKIHEETSDNRHVSPSDKRPSANENGRLKQKQELQLSLFETRSSPRRQLSPDVKSSVVVRKPGKEMTPIKGHNVRKSVTSALIGYLPDKAKGETSHTIIFAQTANIMSHVGSQNNNQQAKTDVNGPVYVENKTNITNTQQTVQNVNQNKTTQVQEKVTTKVTIKEEEKNATEALPEGTVNTKSVEEQQLVAEEIVTLNQRKSNVAANSLKTTDGKVTSTGNSKSRRSLRNHPDARQNSVSSKDPAMKAKQIWSSIKNRMDKIQQIQTKPKRQIASSRNDGIMNDLQFELLYQLVQMIKEFKEYQAKKKLKQSLPTSGPKRVILKPKNFSPVRKSEFVQQQTKPMRKSIAQSKISSARDLMASSFNYISEPVKVSKIVDIHANDVNFNGLSAKNNQFSKSTQSIQSQYIGASLGNAGGISANHFNFKAKSETTFPMETAKRAQTTQSSVQDFILNPNAQTMTSNNDPANDIFASGKFQATFANDLSFQKTTLVPFSPNVKMTTPLVKENGGQLFDITSPPPFPQQATWPPVTTPPTYISSGQQQKIKKISAEPKFKFRQQSQSQEFAANPDSLNIQGGLTKNPNHQQSVTIPRNQIQKALPQQQQQPLPQQNQQIFKKQQQQQRQKQLHHLQQQQQQSIQQQQRQQQQQLGQNFRKQRGMSMNQGGIQRSFSQNRRQNVVTGTFNQNNQQVFLQKSMSEQSTQNTVMKSMNLPRNSGNSLNQASSRQGTVPVFQGKLVKQHQQQNIFQTGQGNSLQQQIPQTRTAPQPGNWVNSQKQHVTNVQTNFNSLNQQGGHDEMFRVPRGNSLQKQRQQHGGFQNFQGNTISKQTQHGGKFPVFRGNFAPQKVNKQQPQLSHQSIRDRQVVKHTQNIGTQQFGSSQNFGTQQFGSSGGRSRIPEFNSRNQNAPSNGRTFLQELSHTSNNGKLVSGTSQVASVNKDTASAMNSLTGGQAASFSWKQMNNTVKSSNNQILMGSTGKSNDNSTKNTLVVANINNSQTSNTINSNTSNVNKVTISNTNINTGGKSSSSGPAVPFVISSDTNFTIIHKKNADGGSIYHIVHDVKPSPRPLSGSRTTTVKTTTTTDREYEIEDPPIFDLFQYFL